MQDLRLNNELLRPSKTCKLKIDFYQGNTVVQTSEIKLGTIEYWGVDYTRENIDCNSADSITGVAVERVWTELP